MDLGALRELYKRDVTTKIFFDHMAQRQRNQTETKVDRILQVLGSGGHDVARGDIVDFFKRLQELECGQFVPGRHGWPSRFVWHVEVTEAARAASGEEEYVPRIQEEMAAPPDVPAFLTHTYNLRPDLQLKFDLPVDLTEREADRLAGFIKSMPMEEYD